MMAKHAAEGNRKKRIAVKSGGLDDEGDQKSQCSHQGWKDRRPYKTGNKGGRRPSADLNQHHIRQKLPEAMAGKPRGSKKPRREASSKIPDLDPKVELMDEKSYTPPRQHTHIRSEASIAEDLDSIGKLPKPGLLRRAFNAAFAMAKGEQDAAEEASGENVEEEDIPAPRTLVINPLRLQGIGSRSVRLFFNKCDDVHVYFDVEAQIEGKWQLLTLPVWNRTGEIVEVLDSSGTILSVIRYSPQVPGPDYDEDSLLWACAVSVMTDQLLLGLEVSKVVQKIRSAYKRYYGDYAALDSDIFDLVHSKEYWKELASRREMSQTVWQEKMIEAILFKKGGSWTRDKVIRAMEGRSTYTTTHTDWVGPIKWGFLSAVLGAFVMGPFSLVLACLVFYCCNNEYEVVHHYGEGVDPRGECMNPNDVLMELYRDCGQAVTVKPCASIHMRTTRVEKDRVYPPKDPAVSLQVDLPYEDGFESKVEVYGATIPSLVCYPDTGPENLYAALRMRMVDYLPYDPKVMASFVNFARSMIDKMPTIDCSVSTDEHLKHLQSTYGAKKGLRLHSMRHKPLRKKNLKTELFVKKESYYKAEEVIKPRMIWNRSELIVAKFAPNFNRIGQALKKFFGPDKQVYYTSGSTPTSVGDFVSGMEGYPYLYECDVSSWDGHVSLPMIELERYFLTTKVVGYEPGVQFLFDDWCHSDGASKDGRVRVSMEGRRRSGELSTSFGNSLINVLITMFVLNVEDFDSSAFRMLVMGDDNLVAHTDYQNAENLVQTYRQLGMKAALLYRDSLEQSTFCSGRFWRVGKGLIWGNLPFKVLSKFGFNHHKHPQHLHKELLYGSAMSLLPTAGHIPVLGAFLRAIIKSAQKKGIKRRNPKAFIGRIQGGNCSYPTVATYQQFSELYGLPMFVAREIERALSKLDIDDFPILLDHEVFVEGVKIDCGNFELPNDNLIVNGLTMKENEEKLIITTIPELEERYKLQNAKTLKEALRKAAIFGSSEDRAFGTASHVYLHMLFTFLSWFCFPLGVFSHRLYNKWALSKQKKPCARRRRRKKFKTKKGPDINVGREAKRLAKHMVKQALIEGGGYVGGLAAGPAGIKIGRDAGAYISSIIGTGDYVVKKNTLSNGVPRFHPANRRTRIHNAEYLTDISGSVEFTSREFSINPGLPSTFPWLSAMANLFEQYTLNGLVFMFRSMSADALNSTNTALGTVIMATQYNSNRPSFSGKLSMENHEFSSTTKPSCDQLHAIECDPNEVPYRQHFVRASELFSGEDINLYDWGKFTIATVGMQATAVIGELWVSYDVTFEKPRLNPEAYPNPLHARLSNGPGTSTDPLGTIQTGYGGNIPIVVGSYTSGFDMVTLPHYVTSGRYLVVYQTHGAAASSSGTVIPVSGCALASSGWGISLDSGWDDKYIESNSTCTVALLDVSASAPSFRVTYGTTFSTVDLWIFQVPSSAAFPINPFSGFQLSSTTLVEEKDDYVITENMRRLHRR